jgi:hypothetical protein
MSQRCLRAIAVVPAQRSGQLRVVDEQGHLLDSVGFTYYGADAPIEGSALDAQLAHLKFRRLDGWLQRAADTFEAPVERF